MTLVFFIIAFLIIDIYVFQAVIIVSRNWTSILKTLFRIGFWIPTTICILGLIWWAFSDPYKGQNNIRIYILAGTAILYFSKLFAVLFLFMDDLQRGVRWVATYFPSQKKIFQAKPLTALSFCRKLL